MILLFCARFVGVGLLGDPASLACNVPGVAEVAVGGKRNQCFLQSVNHSVTAILIGATEGSGVCNAVLYVVQRY